MAAAGVPQPRRVRDPSLADAIIPLVTLVVLIAGSLALFGLDALDGPVQVALILCVLTVALIVLKNGHSWEEVHSAAQNSLASIASAIFILLAVGALIGVWNLSGTIPTLIYYGITILSPGWYYAAPLALTAATLFAGVLGAFLQPRVMAGFVSPGTGAVAGSIKRIWLTMAKAAPSVPGPCAIAPGIPD